MSYQICIKRTPFSSIFPSQILKSILPFSCDSYWCIVLLNEESCQIWNCFILSALTLENSESTVSASTISNFMNSTIVRSTFLQEIAELFHIAGKARLMSHKATVCACVGESECIIYIVCYCKSMRVVRIHLECFALKKLKEEWS